MGVNPCRIFKKYLAASNLGCSKWDLLLRPVGFSLIVVYGFSCPMAYGILVSWSGIKSVPCVGKQILNHWITREVLLYRIIVRIKLFMCLIYILPAFGGFPAIKICLHWGKSGFDSWVEKIQWRKEWLPMPAFLPGEFHAQGSLAGYSPWGCKESDMTEWLTFSPAHSRCSTNFDSLY